MAGGRLRYRHRRGLRCAVSGFQLGACHMYVGEREREREPSSSSHPLQRTASVAWVSVVRPAQRSALTQAWGRGGWGGRSVRASGAARRGGVERGFHAVRFGCVQRGDGVRAVGVGGGTVPPTAVLGKEREGRAGLGSCSRPRTIRQRRATRRMNSTAAPPRTQPAPGQHPSGLVHSLTHCPRAGGRQAHAWLRRARGGDGGGVATISLLKTGCAVALIRKTVVCFNIQQRPLL
jgi:hypothetical protein